MKGLKITMAMIVLVAGLAFVAAPDVNACGGFGGQVFVNGFGGGCANGFCSNGFVSNGFVSNGFGATFIQPQPFFVQSAFAQPVFVNAGFRNRVVVRNGVFGRRSVVVNAGGGGGSVFVRRGLFGRRSVVVGF